MNFAISRNTDTDCIFGILFLILLSFFEPLKSVLISMVTILMMSAKMTDLGLLNIKVL